MIIVFCIKKLRLQRDMTIKQLSIRSEISTTHISDIENNKKMPSILTLELIAKGLKVKVTELYEIERY